MTRINCIPVEDLHVKHLVAEYRELPRTFTLAKNFYERKDSSLIPKQYTLGTGHVKFFYDKLGYLAERHKQLVNEMLRRGYNPTFTDDLKQSFVDIPSKYWNNWVPTQKAIDENLERINQRISEFKT